MPLRNEEYSIHNFDMIQLKLIMTIRDTRIKFTKNEIYG